MVFRFNKNLFKSQSGQYLVFYALFMTMVMILVSIPFNTALMVNYKIRVQQTVDMAAHAAASTMAFYMANTTTDPAVRDNLSIAEINHGIMGKFFSFLHNTTLVQCSQDVNQPAYHCASEMDLRAEDSRTLFCDSNQPMGIMSHYAGKNAELSINAFYSQYVSDFNLAFISAKGQSEFARKKAEEIAIATLKTNLPTLDEREILVKVSPVEFETPKINVVGTYHIGRGVPGDCIVPNNIHTKPLSQVPWGIELTESLGSGYVLVGVHQRGHVAGNSGTRPEDKPPIAYLNWQRLLGNQSSPSFQAFAAAAPIRRLDGVYRDLQNLISTEAAKLQNFINSDPVAQPDDRAEALGYLQNNTQFRFDNRRETLLYPNPPLRVRFIPLSGEVYARDELGGTENAFYGHGNPFRAGLSSALFRPIFEFGNIGKAVYQHEMKYLQQHGYSDAELAYGIFKH